MKLLIDLDPTNEGQVGQIIEFWHDMDVRSIIAPSYRNFLEIFANDLEADIYEVDKHGLKYKKDKK